jgi:hypothetical protein
LDAIRSYHKRLAQSWLVESACRLAVRAMTTYELWETQANNVMASFEHEGQALAAIIERARQHGAESIESLALVHVGDVSVDDDGEEDADMVMVAEGADLLARAQASASDEAPPARRALSA